VVGLLAVGAAAVVAVVAVARGQIGEEKVETIKTARRMASTSGLGRSARGLWNQMEGSMRGCGVMPSLPSRRHLHRRRSLKRTAESREQRNCRYEFFETAYCSRLNVTLVFSGPALYHIYSGVFTKCFQKTENHCVPYVDTMWTGSWCYSTCPSYHKTDISDF